MSQRILVKIINCSNESSWYATCIGAMFECYDEDGRLLVADDKDNPRSPQVRMIDKDDCLIRSAEQRNEAVTPIPAARYCSECKALLEDRSVYCDVCGTDAPLP